MSESYDVVIVGARVAGAALATYLARAGVRVLLLDRSALPSDLVLSTHTIHPTGMAVADDLGIGDAVRARCTEMRTLRFAWQGIVLDIAQPAGEGEFCPRRKRFDGLLQAAALRHGAEVRELTTVSGLEWGEGRVTGVRLSGKNGESVVRAKIVVGADGRHSRVAEWTRAEEYLGYDAPRGMYWSYWPAPRGWGITAANPCGMYLNRDGTTVRVAFHTDDDQLLLGTLPISSELPAFRARPLASLRSTLEGNAFLRDIALGSEPSEPVRGYTGGRYFLRRAAGKGWVLLGDAGIHKDFLSGDGMSEALLQARDAATAIRAALDGDDQDAPLVRFWRSRDVGSLPLYFFARDLADPGASAALDRAVFAGLAREPELHRAFQGIFSRKAHPYTAFSVPTLLRWCVTRALRGEPSVLRDFWRRGEHTRRVLAELHARQKLLNALPARGTIARATGPMDSSVA